MLILLDIIILSNGVEAGCNLWVGGGDEIGKVLDRSAHLKLFLVLWVFDCFHQWFNLYIHHPIKLKIKIKFRIIAPNIILSFKRLVFFNFSTYSCSFSFFSREFCNYVWIYSKFSYIFPLLIVFFDFSIDTKYFLISYSCILQAAVVSSTLFVSIIFFIIVFLIKFTKSDIDILQSPNINGCYTLICWFCKCSKLDFKCISVWSSCCFYSPFNDPFMLRY